MSVGVWSADFFASCHRPTGGGSLGGYQGKEGVGCDKAVVRGLSTWLKALTGWLLESPLPLIVLPELFDLLNDVYIGTWTLQSVCIYLTRSHYPEYNKIQ